MSKVSGNNPSNPSLSLQLDNNTQNISDSTKKTIETAKDKLTQPITPKTSESCCKRAWKWIKTSWLITKIAKFFACLFPCCCKKKPDPKKEVPPITKPIEPVKLDPKEPAKDPIKTEPKDPATTDSKDDLTKDDCELTKQFNFTLDKWAFLDGCLDEYENMLNEDFFQTPKGLAYLRAELISLKKEIDTLAETNRVVSPKLIKDKTKSEKTHYVIAASEKITDLSNRYNAFVENLRVVVNFLNQGITKNFDSELTNFNKNKESYIQRNNSEREELIKEVNRKQNGFKKYLEAYKDILDPQVVEDIEGKIKTWDSEIKALIERFKKDKETVSPTDTFDFEAIRKTLRSKPLPINNPNTNCFLNGPLQALMAVSSIRNMLSTPLKKKNGESDSDFKGRKLVFEALNRFRDAWEKGEDSRTLGKCVTNLRQKVAQANLSIQDMGLENGENGFQDAGAFLEVIVFTFGLNFNYRIKQSAMVNNESLRDRVESLQLQLLYVKTPNPKLNFQERLNNQFKPTLENRSIDNAWRVEDKKGVTHNVTQVQCQESIEGSPPPFLICRVGIGLGLDPYQVTTADEKPYDFTQVFGRTSKDPVFYQLKGFVQYHPGHYTAVANYNNKWHVCNDSSVKEVKPNDSDFKDPCNWMILELVPQKKAD